MLDIVNIWYLRLSVNHTQQNSVHSNASLWKITKKTAFNIALLLGS